jgi:hypothetical protein
MTNAYDPKELASRLKGRGLDLAEEGTKIAIEEIFGWVEESAKISATPYDDMATVVLPHLKKFALEQADKIDGQVG